MSMSKEFSNQFPRQRMKYYGLLVRCPHLPHPDAYRDRLNPRQPSVDQPPSDGTPTRRPSTHSGHRCPAPTTQALRTSPHPLPLSHCSLLHLDRGHMLSAIQRFPILGPGRLHQPLRLHQQCLLLLPLLSAIPRQLVTNRTTDLHLANYRRGMKTTLI
jgi:hypothetical protein